MNDFTVFMAGPGWALFSAAAAVFAAGFYLVNQYFKMPGHLVTFWMRVMIVLGMAPIMTQLPMPKDPLFYGFVFLSVLFGTTADIRAMNASRLYGGGVVSRVMPLSVWGAFFIWLFAAPETIGGYLAHPLNSLGILSALAVCVYFSMRLNKTEVNKQAFAAMLPALIGYAAANVVNKKAMAFGLDAGHLAGAVYGYMFWQSAMAVPIVGAYCAWRAKRDVGTAPVNGRLLAVAALLVALAWFCHMIYKNYAMAYTPNPAYMAAIGLLAPVFVTLFYKMTGHREENDVASGFGVVLSALALAVLTVS
jgi:hypothetical protein